MIRNPRRDVRFHAIAIALAVVFAACAPQLVVRLKAINDPDRPLSMFTSFQTATTGACQESELLEKHLLRLVADRLRAKGMREVAEKGETVVRLRCRLESVREYVPPKTYYVPVTSQSTTESSTAGSVGSTPVKEESSSTTTQTHYVPVTEAGYHITRQAHRIAVRIETPPTKATGASAPGAAVWEGEVESRTTTTDTLLIAPLLLDELFTEFPIRSGRPLTRTVKWKPPR